MIIVRLIGGLGNQMFQYSFAKALADKYGEVLKLDINGLINRGNNNHHKIGREYSLDIFDISEDFASTSEVNRHTKRMNIKYIDKLLDRLLGHKNSYILEKQYNFSELLIHFPNSVLLEGYWQSEKYFYSIKQELKKIFTFKQSPEIDCEPWLNEINSTNSVCVHVRRGDFLVNLNHGFCGLKYYQEAEKIMSKRISNPHYFIFSDDIEWCRENLQFFPRVKFIPKELSGYKDQDHLRMMSFCKNFIIANSSFSWWAVWLGKNENHIVIAPSNWYKPAKNLTDIYQPGWIVI